MRLCLGLLFLQYITFTAGVPTMAGIVAPSSFCKGKKLEIKYPDPLDCGYFYFCGTSYTVRQRCAPGTFFNDVSKDCDFPESIPRCKDQLYGDTGINNNHNLQGLVENEIIQIGSQTKETDAFRAGSRTVHSNNFERTKSKTSNGKSNDILSTSSKDTLKITSDINTKHDISADFIPSMPSDSVFDSDIKLDSYYEVTTTTNKQSQNSSVIIEFENHQKDSQEPFCLGKRPDNYADPSNCEYFYQCSVSVSRRQRCAPETVFNPLKNYCDHPENVPNCKDLKFQTKISKKDEQIVLENLQRSHLLKSIQMKHARQNSNLKSKSEKRHDTEIRNNQQLASPLNQKERKKTMNIIDKNEIKQIPLLTSAIRDKKQDITMKNQRQSSADISNQKAISRRIIVGYKENVYPNLKRKIPNVRSNVQKNKIHHPKDSAPSRRFNLSSPDTRTFHTTQRSRVKNLFIKALKSLPQEEQSKLRIPTTFINRLNLFAEGKNAPHKQSVSFNSHTTESNNKLKTQMSRSPNSKKTFQRYNVHPFIVPIAGPGGILKWYFPIPLQNSKGRLEWRYIHIPRPFEGSEIFRSSVKTGNNLTMKSA